jgi:DNA-binding response OmpR family regulator
MRRHGRAKSYGAKCQDAHQCCVPGARTPTMNIRNEDETSAKIGIADVAEAWALRFDRFVFDLRRGEVRDSNGIAVPLRPKAELLLRQFLSRPGRLLSKEELIAAVWPPCGRHG